jgi:hypothetical protein
MADLSLYTRVYVGRGKKAHLRPNDSGRYFVARCGVAPAWYDPNGWYGTGSQEEIDKAKAMPLCKRCLMALEGSTWK